MNTAGASGRIAAPDRGPAPVAAPDPTAAMPALSDAAIQERIVEAILDHRLPPGTKLVEERLGRAFGVSRTRVRQVLIRLAGQRIVTLTPNRGATVARPDPDEAREVLAVRRLIEPPIVEAFVARAGAADFARLDALLAEESAARASGRRGDAIRLSGAFHMAIAERAGNRTLERMLAELVSRTSLILMTYGPAPLAPAAHGPGCHGETHSSLVDTMRAGRGATAARAMIAHLAELEAALSLDVPDEGGVDLETLFGGAAPAAVAGSVR